MSSITGVRGRVRWAYYDAAILAQYTLTREDGIWRLAGQVLMLNAIMLQQRPLLFEVPHAGGAWRWPIEVINVQDGRLSATLGPPRS